MLITLDFETYYDKQYSLSKMTTEEYVRDPRFKVHGVGIKVNDLEAKYFYGNQLPHALAWIRQRDNDLYVLAHNCIPGDVEILTPSGWLPIADVTCDIPVMQWDELTSELSWAYPAAKHKTTAAELLRWDTAFHTCSYTPDHRMVYHTPDRLTWRFAPAATIATLSPNNTYIPLSGVYLGGDIHISNDVARLTEAVRADGSWSMVDGKCYGVQFKLKKKRKQERLFELCAALAIPTTVTKLPTGVTAVRLLAHPHINMIFSLLGREKRYTKNLALRLCMPARLAILDETQFWDGSQRTPHSFAYATVDAETVDAFAIMAHLSGWMQTVGNWDTDNNRGFGTGVNKPLWRGMLRHRSRAKLVEKPTSTPNHDPVYCITVPTGAFMVRSNGKIHITGNCRFDGAILSWRYGIRPKFWLDTLSMARAVFPHESHSLANLSRLCGLGEKGHEVQNTLGKRDLTEEEQQALGEYCLNDVELTYQLFQVLKQGFPAKELKVIDQTIRMFTEPELEIDTTIITEHLAELTAKKQRLLNGRDITTLRSNQQFAELLEQYGGALPPSFFGHFDTNQDWLIDWDRYRDYMMQRTIRCGGLPHTFDVPTKISARTRKPTYAFAKSDEGMLALLDHEDEDVQLLAAARLGVKSSIEESRTLAFLGIASRGPLPIPINYFGAQNTGRDSGSDKINMQNLPRGGALRKCISAPRGKLLAVADFAQIEARMLAWLAGQWDLVEAFAQKHDVYCQSASSTYNQPINKKDHPLERQVGKVTILGAGYGMGGPKFGSYLASGPMGSPPILFRAVDAERMGVDYSRVDPTAAVRVTTKLHGDDLLAHVAVSQYIIDTYRQTYPMIPKYWKQCSQIISAMSRGLFREFGPIYTEQDCIVMPNGQKLQYRNLRLETVKKEKTNIQDGEEGGVETRWVYDGKRGEKQYIYGGKLCENIDQALSCIVMKEAAVKIGEEFKVVMRVHDEIVCCIDEIDAKDCLDFMLDVMRTPPTWAAGLPLDAEGALGKNYGEAK